MTFHRSMNIIGFTLAFVAMLWQPLVVTADDPGGGILGMVSVTSESSTATESVSAESSNESVETEEEEPENNGILGVVESGESTTPEIVASTNNATTTEQENNGIFGLVNATLPPTFVDIDCETLHFDCYNCIQSGCYWCPTDGLCFNTSEFVSHEPNKQKLYPDRFHGCQTPESFTTDTCTAPGNFFADPLYSAQNWIFSNIKLKPVWEMGYFGKGIRVRINDAGIETTHPEFFGRLDIDASCPNGTAESFFSSHGMTVASLVGANANNSICGVGVAPEVTMSSCWLGEFSRPDMLQYKLEDVDISQNSWAFDGCGRLSLSAPRSDYVNRKKNLRRGLQNNNCRFQYVPFENYALDPCLNCNFTNNNDELGEECIQSIIQHCDFYPTKDRRACMEFLDLILMDANPTSEGECHFGILNEDALDALTRGVTEGRDGKGIVFVFAAGNEFNEGDNTNFQGWGANTRFTIPVGAIGKPGNVSSYSTPGASVFISAPGGDDKQSVTRVVAASNGGTCKDMGTGSSFAAPVVTGVVALMLEANPDLTWRDVQHILATTAQVRNDGWDPSFAVNSAGVAHSNRYGFGIVDAEAAVNASLTWVNIEPEVSLMAEGKGSVVIPDSRRNSTKFSLNLTSARPFRTESVYLYLKVNHSSRGHLRITLTSPGGMLSVMAPGERPESQQTGWMKFTSVRHWKENPNGEWIISVTDTTSGTVNECISYQDYVFEYDYDETLSFNLTCAPQDGKLLAQFCANGKLAEDSEQAYLCNEEKDKAACDRLKRFQNHRSNGRNATEACCMCGGGFHPSKLPETVEAWKLVVFGHERTMEGFFSGIGNDVELGRWGGRGVAREGGRFHENNRPVVDEPPKKIGALGNILAFFGLV